MRGVPGHFAASEAGDTASEVSASSWSRNGRQTSNQVYRGPGYYGGSARSKASLSEDFLAARFGGSRPTNAQARREKDADPVGGSSAHLSRYIPASSGPLYARPRNGPTGPSTAYLAGTREVSTLVKTASDERQPQLVVVNLNGTLCVRPERNPRGAINVSIRPYASSFLEYLFASIGENGTSTRRFAVMVSMQCLCREIKLSRNFRYGLRHSQKASIYY